MKKLISNTIAFILSFAATAQADQVIIDDVIINKLDFATLLCVGEACEDGESVTARALLRLKGETSQIEFIDTSTVAGEPDLKWTIRANDISVGGQEALRFLHTGAVSSFAIEGGAPENALWVDDTGNIGVGTSLPTANLHILSDSTFAELKLEQTTGTPGGVNLRATDSAFEIRSLNTGISPFFIQHRAPGSAFKMLENGDIGLGVPIPEGKLHTKGDGVQLAYFESGDGGPVQVRFRTDSENRRFLAVNNADEVKSQIIFLDDRINFTGETDSGANLWLSIGPDGIVSQGPTCGTPCDLTFDPEVFTVPPIEERAAYMWENMHLPAIGPTKPGEIMNMTEKMGGVIHELEVAHIYIEQQHALIKDMRAEMEAMSARLSQLEGRSDDK